MPNIEPWNGKAHWSTVFEMYIYWCISWVDRITNNKVLRWMNKQKELLVTFKERKTWYFSHIELICLIIEGNDQSGDGRIHRWRTCTAGLTAHHQGNFKLQSPKFSWPLGSPTTKKTQHTKKKMTAKNIASVTGRSCGKLNYIKNFIIINK